MNKKVKLGMIIGGLGMTAFPVISMVSSCGTEAKKSDPNDTPTSPDQDLVDQYTPGMVSTLIKQKANFDMKADADSQAHKMPTHMVDENGVNIDLTVDVPNNSDGIIGYDVTKVWKGDATFDHPSFLSGSIQGFNTAGISDDQKAVDNVTAQEVFDLINDRTDKSNDANTEAAKLNANNTVTTANGVVITFSATAVENSGFIMYSVESVVKNDAFRATETLKTLNGNLSGFKQETKTDQQDVDGVTSEQIKGLLEANVNKQEDAQTASDQLNKLGKVTDGNNVVISFTTSANQATGTVNFQVTSVVKNAASKANPESLNGQIIGFFVPGPTPTTNTIFAPYVDPTQETANIKEAEDQTGNKMHSVTLAFLNRDRGTTDYSFGGKSLADVKKMITDAGSALTNPVLAIGGVVAGDPGSQFVLPTITPNDGITEDNATIADKLYSDIKAVGAHEFDWDIEGFALANDGPAREKSAQVAKLIQDKALADGYKLQQLITLPTQGCNSNKTDPSTVTKAEIDAVTELEGFSYAAQEAVKAFYNAGVNVIANGMTMEYVWKTNYDVQTILEIGGMYKTVEKAETAKGLGWTPEQIYNHLGVTPMIGHQAQAEGIYSYDQGVKYTAKWAKELGLGFIGFWSLTRDHPLPQGASWKNNPTSYGLSEGSDYIYTKNFLADLGL